MSSLIEPHVVVRVFFGSLQKTRNELQNNSFRIGALVLTINSSEQHRNQFVKNTLAESTFNCIWRAHLRRHPFVHLYPYVMAGVFATAVFAVHSINKFNDPHALSAAQVVTILFFFFPIRLVERL